MYNPYAFFDVDSLELSPNGRTYTCHPQSSSVSDDLYEVYSIISSLSAPVLFTIDVKRNIPKENTQRCDFLSIPVDESDTEWRSTVKNWLKFYIARGNNDNKKEMAVFKDNKNAFECAKLMQAHEWIVFGNGITNGVDDVMTTLLGSFRIVKFIPELIIPSESETEEQLKNYCKKWETLGGIPITLDDITEIVRCHRF